MLTIGFARRVPTYKRLTLMLRDPERLRALLTHPTRPVQIVIAGKSHPADDEGKRLIQQLIEFAAAADVRHRMVFLPNYDIAMAQLLYPGTDIWLNNPLRPLEACGTSGMKAALNGSLNLSILDGWWAEFFDGENGWAIPTADTNDPSERDDLEAHSMYDLIEHQIAPRFYDRGEDGVPTRWVESIRHTLATLSPALSADRMVKEYVNRLYIPGGAVRARDLGARLRAGARAVRRGRRALTEAWPRVQVLHVESGGVDVVPQIGDSLHVRARVALDGLTPDDVEGRDRLRARARRRPARRHRPPAAHARLGRAGPAGHVHGYGRSRASGELRLQRERRAIQPAARQSRRAGAHRRRPLNVNTVRVLYPEWCRGRYSGCEPTANLYPESDSRSRPVLARK